MLSGGPDSTAMLAGLVRLVGNADVVALHLNYGLRPDSDRDQAACEQACRELGVELEVRRPERPHAEGDGNLHDWARQTRYQAAETLAGERRLDWIAVGHTATDLAETVIYRLTSSPGTRAITAMPARRGIVIRPLLGLEREAVRAATVESGLPFVDDPSNLDPSFARSRIRSEVMPVLRDLNPGAVANISRTRREIEEEADLVGSIAAGLISTDDRGQVLIPADELIAAHPAVARHAIRTLAEAATSGIVPVSVDRTSEIRRLCLGSEGGRVDLGAGVSIMVESGKVRAGRTGKGSDRPESVTLDLPGEVEWGGWRLAAERVRGPVRPRGPEVATLDASGLSDRVEVRGWSEGDRIRQLGMDGSKPVSDLFAERGIARSERPSRPVVTAGGEVVWVPGVAIADRLRIASGTREVVLLTADLADDDGAP